MSISFTLPFLFVENDCVVIEAEDPVTERFEVPVS